MPGLLRGMARTAVVAGTATAVSNRVSRRQANRWASQGSYPPQYEEPQQQYAPPRHPVRMMRRAAREQMVWLSRAPEEEEHGQRRL